MTIEVETENPTTPAWALARNCGVPVREVIEALERRGLTLVLDRECKPAFLTADIYSLIVSE